MIGDLGAGATMFGMKRLFFIVLLAAATAPAAEVDLGRLTLPPGFHISVFADTKGHPRLMTFSPGGVLLATATTEGTVLAFPDARHSGRAERIATVLSDLNAPHGIAFYEGKLYVAETNRVARYDWDEASLRASNPQVITQLPGSGMHFTRTLLFVNGKMYVSIGSDCNVCDEKDERRATVMEFNPDGTGGHIFARGLRNAVGLAYNTKTGTIWTSENGRDFLGDNLPPDEINELGKSGGDFGWPACYGNRVIDPTHREEGEKRCPTSIPAKVALQAHSAPLGVAFYYANQFPEEYRGDLFVAFHGSWNRSVPTGYKVVRIHLKNGTDPQGVEDFITGWIAPGEQRKGAWMGRPMGVAVASDGSMFISDDTSGPIYRVTYGK
jgi:glucose/arabinose dehydrogenase